VLATNRSSKFYNNKRSSLKMKRSKNKRKKMRAVLNVRLMSQRHAPHSLFCLTLR
jgi:hypothetical protein